MAENHLGRKIQNLRRQANLTQQDLAMKLTTASSTISNWETGRRLPSIVDLTRMAEVFNVSLSTFELQASMLTDLSNLRTNIENTQQISYRPKMIKLNPNLRIVLYVSIIFLYTSLFLPSLIDTLFLLMGSSGILFFIVTYLITYVSQRQKQYTTRLIPLTSKVFYQNKLPKEQIYDFKLRLTLGAVISMFLGLLFYVLAIYGLYLLNNPVASMFGTVLAFSGISIQFYRYKSLSKNDLYVHNIDYHKTNKNFMRYAIISTLLFELFIYTLMIGLIIVIGYALFSSFFNHLIGLLGLFMIFASIDLLNQYHKFTSNFQIIIQDADDHVSIE
jgi:transcriptional regulator with XRE-family HTH domain